ncbi:MAG TPA: tetratricopeptide repeat protein, partial [Kofleriaceae bacterium]|nr:tetratricopeptide repeat protein [Kofleriaceae bacterium]
PDPVDKIGEKIVKLESEAQQLSQTIQRPGVKTGDVNKANRRLVDAQVAFGVGNYDDAAVMLYDYVAKYPTSRSYDQALYYLAESLFLKGDLYASRTYYMKLVQDVGTRSKFYQQGLERLIELSLKLRDDDDVQDWLDALDKVPSGQQRDSVPYVRGKFAYFSGNYDEAMTFFKRVKSTSQYGFQARYFYAGAQVAKGDLIGALRTYQGLLRAPPRNDDEKKVIELTHLAMGRVYYECDTPEQCGISLSADEQTKIQKEYERAELDADQLEEKYADFRTKKLWSMSIDRYLRISRLSPLFDEALYEIAWVYVKNKSHEKALRALELLALADPDSSKMPEVRILEGNLRIRRAQVLQYGTTGNSVEEYDRAYTVFDETRKTFKEPHAELVQIIADHRDPRTYMAQVTGRASDTFDVSTTMPEVAAEWLRRQPDVERVVVIETDLGQIRDEIAQAEATINRLELATSASQGVNIFPALADKRARSVEILEQVFDNRIQLMNHEKALILKHASADQKARLEQLSKTRQQAFAELKALPNAEVGYGDRIRLARNEFEELDRTANEVALTVETTEATLVAIVKYLDDRRQQGAKPEELAALEEPIKEVRAEIDAMRLELEAIRRDGTLARDRAGVGDENATRGTTLRARVREAIEAEHQYMVQIASGVSGGDRAKLDQIIALARRANTISETLDGTNERIDATVEAALDEVRGELAAEKAQLAAYKREYLEYEAESRELGGEVLEANFGNVRDTFYDVLVRSDIGVIDVTWAQREFADKTLKQLELDKKRDGRTLRIDFDQILKEEKAAKDAAREQRAKEAGGGTP